MSSLLPGIEPTTNENNQDELLQLNPFIQDSQEPKTLEIPMGSQWLLQLSKQELIGQNIKLYITIKTGVAEILGTELVNDKEYCFQNWNFSIFAIEDIVLNWRLNLPTMALKDIDQPQNIISNDTARYVYNLHFALEKLRNSSFAGPKVLILGPQNVGKTSLARTLCSYAIKFKNYQPMFINLDTTQPIVSPPGCLMATPISDLIDVESPIWNQSLTSGATELHGRQPILKNFGLENVHDNKELYTEMLSHLSQVVNERLNTDLLVQRSGLIVDSPNWLIQEENHDTLKMVVDNFKIDVIIIMDTLDKQVQLQETFNKFLDPNKGGVTIVIPPMCGIIPNDDIYKRSLQRIAIRDYFYGNDKTVLSPYLTNVDFEDLIVWSPQTQFTILDNNIESDANDDKIDNNNTKTQGSLLKFSQVNIDPSSLQHALVVITFSPKRSAQEEIIKSSLMGFGLITEVNEKRRKVKILLPVPGNLPNNALILTAYRYLE